MAKRTEKTDGKGKDKDKDKVLSERKQRTTSGEALASLEGVKIQAMSDPQFKKLVVVLARLANIVDENDKFKPIA